MKKPSKSKSKGWDHMTFYDKDGKPSIMLSQAHGVAVLHKDGWFNLDHGFAGHVEISHHVAKQLLPWLEKFVKDYDAIYGD